IADFFDRGWRSNPNCVAFIAGDQTYTYQAIGAMSCRVANALRAQGFAPETKGAVLAPNDPMAWACGLGLWRAAPGWGSPHPAHPAGAHPSLARRFRLRGAVRTREAAAGHSDVTSESAPAEHGSGARS